MFNSQRSILNVQFLYIHDLSIQYRDGTYREKIDYS